MTPRANVGVAVALAALLVAHLAVADTITFHREVLQPDWQEWLVEVHFERFRRDELTRAFVCPAAEDQEQGHGVVTYPGGECHFFLRYSDQVEHHYFCDSRIYRSSFGRIWCNDNDGSSIEIED